MTLREPDSSSHRCPCQQQVLLGCLTGCGGVERGQPATSVRASGQQQPAQQQRAVRARRQVADESFSPDGVAGVDAQPCLGGVDLVQQRCAGSGCGEQGARLAEGPQGGSRVAPQPFEPGDVQQGQGLLADAPTTASRFQGLAQSLIRDRHRSLLQLGGGPLAVGVELPLFGRRQTT